MIMVANPKVGDAFRTENSPGFAFEEVSVKAVDQTLDGPLGPITGGLVVRELHIGEGSEDKSFAPGYGEFYTAAGPDVEALALAIPTDAAPGPLPTELTTIKAGADAIFAAAGSKQWNVASAEVANVTTAWTSYLTGGVPRLIEPQMTAALGSIGRAVKARNVARSRQAAINVARSSLDLQLRYRPAAEVNLARFELWAAQVVIDAGARDAGAIRGDAYTLTYIRDRLLGSLDGAELTRLNTRLQELQVAAVDGDVPAAMRAASELRKIAGTQP
jgi:hypothetical protein